MSREPRCELCDRQIGLTESAFIWTRRVSPWEIAVCLWCNGALNTFTRPKCLLDSPAPL